MRTGELAVSAAQQTATFGSGFFSDGLRDKDGPLYEAIRRELHRQQDEIELIASENIVSSSVLEATGSVLTNKYAEGYPGKRFYGGCQHVDEVETLAIERAKQLFNCGFANVQPNSGSQANQAVLLALAKPGDAILGLSLAAGGHLTHGAAPNLSGKWFSAIHYTVRREDQRIDMNEVRTLAIKNKPKILIAGGSAYPRTIDFAAFRSIADEVGAYLMVDMSHFAGLVAGGVHPSPLEHAHVVTTTTHKTLRGPRGGLILMNDEEIAKKINSAVFPGLQGGPLMHIIAAKAASFGEALRPDFKTYARAVVENCRVMGEVLVAAGYDLVSGGTDTHLILLDLRPRKLTGNISEKALGRARITCNKNGVPFDPEKPTVTSGIRLGTPACTTRGFGVAEFREVGRMIAEVLDGLTINLEAGNVEVTASSLTEAKVREEVAHLCKRFPIYRI
jgi:glycine hydroxymethyltransferase